MTANERISRWRGEKRTCGPSKHPDICKCGALRLKGGCLYDDAPDYTTDPAAWTPELWRAIYVEPMWFTFLDYLCIATTGGSLDRGLQIHQLSEMLKATPAQKAEALSKAIAEVE